MDKSEKVLVLRTCAADMTAHGGFQWPESGPVECQDWKPVAACGNGLHGLLWGQGDYGLLNKSFDAKWLVVEVEKSEIVKIGEKVKFPRGNVVYCGNSRGAIELLRNALAKRVKVATKVKTTTGYAAHAATTGEAAHAATTGDAAHAATTGYAAHAATTGRDAHAATTGYAAHAATTGRDAHAATTARDAHAATTGYAAHAATTGYAAHAATTGHYA